MEPDDGRAFSTSGSRGWSALDPSVLHTEHKHGSVALFLSVNQNTPGGIWVRNSMESPLWSPGFYHPPWANVRRCRSVEVTVMESVGGSTSGSPSAGINHSSELSLWLLVIKNLHRIEVLIKKKTLSWRQRGARGDWKGFILPLRTWARRSVLDGACNAICHVLVGGPVLSTLSHSLRAFCRQMDHPHRKISPEYLVCLQKPKKIRTPIKVAQQANKGCQWVSAFSFFFSFCKYAALQALKIRIQPFRTK